MDRTQGLVGRSMRRLWLLGLALLSGCHEDVRDDQIRVGVSPDYPNFEFRQKGELVGFEVDLVKEIGQRMHKEIVFVPLPFASLLPELQLKRIDMIASGMTPTEKKRKHVDFSNIFYRNQLYGVTREGLQAFRTISGQSGTRMELLGKRWAQRDGLQYRSLAHNNMIIEEVKNGRIDVGILEKSVALMFVQKNRGLRAMALDPAVLALDPTEDGIAFAFRKGDPLQHTINGVLQTLIREGKIQTYAKKWSME